MSKIHAMRNFGYTLRADEEAIVRKLEGMVQSTKAVRMHDLEARMSVHKEKVSRAEKIEMATVDVALFIQENKDVVTNGRMIARVFHGISSPLFPTYEWSQNKYWNKHPYVDFHDIMEYGNKLLAKSKAA